MPVYSPPNFNVFADLWFGTRTPADGFPDFENQACQFYIASRGYLDITPGDLELWVPPIYMRLPFASIVNWRSFQIAEIPAESGRFFSVRWKEIMHLGFPNQYFMALLEQCDATGSPIFRDVGGGATPGGSGTGVFDGGVGGSGSGSGSGGTGPVDHTGDGTATEGIGGTLDGGVTH